MRGLPGVQSFVTWWQPGRLELENDVAMRHAMLSTSSSSHMSASVVQCIYVNSYSPIQLTDNIIPFQPYLCQCIGGLTGGQRQASRQPPALFAHVPHNM